MLGREPRSIHPRSSAFIGGHLAMILLLTALAPIGGCDLESFSEPATPAECSEIGARCQLPDGPIGVCQRSPCPPDEIPPCFKCTPQH